MLRILIGLLIGVALGLLVPEWEGIAILGLSSMSFQPQGPDPQTGAPSSTLELSANPGVKYVYLGNSFVDGHNIKNLLLVEVPEGVQ